MSMLSIDWSFIVALILAVTVHEFSHAWMSTYLGDPTAKYLGRLSLNPLAHLDPMGTLLLLIAGFGWGKPVPFNSSNLKNPRLDSALIALAGPLSNLLLAFIFAIPYRYLFVGGFNLQDSSTFLIETLTLFRYIIDLNLLLMIFNLLPIPPLDGGKVFSLLIPGNFLPLFLKYRNYGYGLLIFIVFLQYAFGISLLGEYILRPTVDFFWDIVLFSS